MKCSIAISNPLSTKRQLLWARCCNGRQPPATDETLRLLFFFFAWSYPAARSPCAAGADVLDVGVNGTIPRHECAVLTARHPARARRATFKRFIFGRAASLRLGAVRRCVGARFSLRATRPAQ